MKCPHCLVEFHPYPTEEAIGNDSDGGWGIEYVLCPKCKKFVIFLTHGTLVSGGGRRKIANVTAKTLVRPKGMSRGPPPPEVPKAFADEFREADVVVADSPKASAALSRRCLQLLLRDVEKVTPGDLSDEIQQVIDRGKLPSYLTEGIDAVRNTGNFAAHPIKSRSSGEIVDVEPGEAEWNLDTLEGLFDFYFVLPARVKEKRDALDKKLKDAGKPPMKGAH